MKRMQWSLTVLSLLVLLTGCSKAATDNDQQSISQQTPASATQAPLAEQGELSALEDAQPPAAMETEPPAPAAETLAQRISGVYCEKGSSTLQGECHVIRVDVRGGVLLVEHSLLMDGSVYSFWAQEIWPEEPSLLDSTEATALSGADYQFSTFYLENSYWDGTERVALQLTEGGLALTQCFADADVSTEYEAVEEQGVWFHNPAAYYAQASQEHPAALTGNWYGAGASQAAWFRLDGDGTFEYLCKEAGMPVFWLRGAWGVGETGCIGVTAERFGGGTMPLDFSLFCETEDGTLWFYEMSDLQNGAAVERFYPLNGESWQLESRLQQELISSLCLAEGTVEGADGSLLYSYNIPQLAETFRNAQSLNACIRSDWEQWAMQAQAGLEAGEAACDWLSWSSSSYRELLTLILQAQSMQYGWQDYVAYYIDTQTGSFLSPAEVLERTGIPEADYLASLKTAITQEFIWENEWMTEEERQVYGYDEGYAQIDQLVYPEQYGVQGYPVLPYLSSDGTLMVYAPVPSLGPDSIVIRLLALPLHCQG